MVVLGVKSSNHLFITHKTVIISYNLQTNSYKTSDLSSHLNSAQITTLTLKNNSDFCAIGTTSKTIYIINIRTLEIHSEFRTNRLISKLVLLTDDNQFRLLVADKSGDVYLYDKPNEGPKFLLGHLSMLLDMAMSDCGRYLITSDRDEKIRISHFPNCYNIAAYCLGHVDYVNFLYVISNSDLLVSGSGDGTLKLWCIPQGNPCLDSIQATVDLVDLELLLERFRCDFGTANNIEINALPITSMQVVTLRDDFVVLAVTIHPYEAIRLFRIDLKSRTFKHFQDVKITNCRLFILDEELICFTVTGCVIYDFNSTNDLYVLNPQKDHRQLSDLLQLQNYANENRFEIDPILNLYKKRFDNVQEYLDRKKLRLETTNKLIKE